MTNDKYYIPLKKEPAGSETSFTLNFVAFILATSVLALCTCLHITNLLTLFVIYVMSLTLFNVTLEMVIYPHTTIYCRWKIRRKIDWKRIFYKEFTLLITLLCIAFFYWLLPMFSDIDMLKMYYPFLKILVPFILIMSIPYFCLMDVIDDDPDDIYYQIGYSVIHLQKIPSFRLGNYVRSWLVKAFWLSLMQPSMVNNINWFIHLSWNIVKETPLQWFWALNSMCFFIDLSYTATGYMVNLKILNSHTRTAEPTLFGWLAAIICYWPFWAILFYPYFFAYNRMNWINYFNHESIIWWTCFTAIILLELIYALATVAAGIRFSNLTYRGLWNTGPYRYTKHPAYVFKNISWWIISIPFLYADPVTAIKLSLLLFGNNLIYYFRAKTEERHLSHYPEYEQYALMMNEKSIFRWCARLLPFLKYKPLTKKERIFDLKDIA